MKPEELLSLVQKLDKKTDNLVLQCQDVLVDLKKTCKDLRDLAKDPDKPDKKDGD